MTVPQKFKLVMNDTRINCSHTRKACHQTRKSAKRHLRILRANGRYPPGQGDIYFCGACNSYHVGLDRR